MTQFKPLKNYVLLKVLDKEKTTKSGIVLIETDNKEESEKGEVVAIGKEVRGEIKVGDVVIFSMSTSTIKKDAKDIYFIVREEDLLAVIN